VQQVGPVAVTSARAPCQGQLFVPAEDSDGVPEEITGARTLLELRHDESPQRQGRRIIAPRYALECAQGSPAAKPRAAAVVRTFMPGPCRRSNAPIAA
jgi:hypothetical protein